MSNLLDGLDKKLERLSEDLVRLKTQADLKGESVTEDERNMTKLRAGITEAEGAVEAKIAEFARLEV